MKEYKIEKLSQVHISLGLMGGMIRSGSKTNIED
jgi:hypothetical protein